jgi:hypothetical protein
MARGGVGDSLPEIFVVQYGILSFQLSPTRIKRDGLDDFTDMTGTLRAATTIS